jgi:hypothetical protein
VSVPGKQQFNRICPSEGCGPRHDERDTRNIDPFTRTHDAQADKLNGARSLKRSANETRLDNTQRIIATDTHKAAH